MLSRNEILNASRSAGFDLCGVARPRPLHANAQHLSQWIEQGCVGGLDYMCRNADKREDATLLVEGTQSVVVCGVSYKSDINTHYTPEQSCKVASYACNRDYHTSLKEMLKELYITLKKQMPTLQARLFTDSAPLLEKQLAVEAGLGWIGRQSLLVTPEFGTFVLLGELVINDEVDHYDTPFAGSRCGDCHRCVDACPNSAILPTKNIDARRCISRLTIEKLPDESENSSLTANRGNASKTGLHGWIFGCDECQSCCPHNRTTPYASNPHFAQPFDPAELTAEEWLTMSEEEFMLRFGQTPLIRSGLQRIQHNIQLDRD